MKNALSRLLSSAKFWTAILGMIATAGASLFARYGLEASTEAIQQLAGTMALIVSVLLHAQGQTDAGKNAAATTAAIGPTPVNTNNVTVNEAPVDQGQA